MYPFFFGNANSQLYGVYHPPLSITKLSSTGVLLSQPIAHEYMRSHWAIRQLAQRLSDRGLHCFRFDYFGTGDSSGESDECSIERWIEDIQTAKEELENLSGTKTIFAVGLRLGASLLMQAAEKEIAFKKIILWDPIIMGTAYIELLEHLHSRQMKNIMKGSILRKMSPYQKKKEFLGHPFPQRLLTGIQNINLLTTKKVNIPKALLCISEQIDDYQSLSKHLASMGNEVKLLHEPGSPGRWEVFDEVGEALFASEIIQKIVDEIA